ncbi:tRNA lysidine(34) synthetase TilS [Gammaproteobacteria bacterium]|nr:tRNA lysidine(34) synthetase TilS [Gammaproteobacteria bacterium]
MFDSKTFFNLVNPSKNILVAFSGGGDSTALLNYCYELKQKNHFKGSLSAIHVNHAISPHASSWEGHCKNFCSQRNIPLICKSIKVDGKKSGLESAARKGRYEVFKHNIYSGDQLLLAHHADDVAETLMFRLFRGTGIDGLGGPIKSRKLGDGVMLRPWLDYSKSILISYLENRKPSFIEDESNASNDQDRNFIRNEILPLISQRWPQAKSQIQQTSSIISQHLDVHEKLIYAQFSDDLFQPSLSLESLKNIDEGMRNSVIRYWIKNNNIAAPNKKVLHEITKVFFQTQPSSKTLVEWSRADKDQSGGVLTFADGDLIINNK